MSLKNCGVITLLTDFGLQDGYVGAMHGVILSICPHARIVDLGHEVRPQDIDEAMFLLQAHHRYFPEGTIHVAVVDPGVGTERKILIARTSRYYFLAPDNGLLSFLRNQPDTEFFYASNPEYWLPQVSSTFHGRDIFSPLAAHLVNGVAVESMATPLQEIVLHAPLAPEVFAGRIRGRVVHVDRFGNLITNIHRSLLPNGIEELQVVVGGQRIGPIVKSYGAVPRGRLLATIGSFDTVEIAVNGGSALRYFKGTRPSVEVYTETLKQQVSSKDSD